MTMIPFPEGKRRREPEDTFDLTFGIIGALSSLGEPATAGELQNLMRPIYQIESDDMSARLVTILNAHSEVGFAGMHDGPIFRRVPLGEEEAWAFTQSFRNQLREAGVQASLRPLPR